MKLSREEKDRLVNGSGLFFWNSNVTLDKKVEIVNWYNEQNKEVKEMIDILKSEASDDASFEYN